MTEFARGLLVGLFLGVTLGGLVVADLLLRWWTGALEEIAAAASRARERNERQADTIRRMQAENDALRAGEGVTLRSLFDPILYGDGDEDDAADDDRDGAPNET